MLASPPSVAPSPTQYARNNPGTVSVADLPSLLTERPSAP